ncbi:MAG: C13 family peptidase, partial [Deltaproteobacteria bacterium]
FSEIMGATLPTIDDYTVNIIEPSTIAAVGGTAKYIVQLLPREKFQGTLNLTCLKVTALSGLTYAFVLNDRRTASLAGLTLPATVTLEVTAGSIAVAEEHHFELQVQNVWESGSSDPRTIPLTLTVVANNGAGIFADLDSAEFGKGEKVRIYGAIWPLPLAERSVTLTITPASGGNHEQRTVKTSAPGKFSESVWTPTLGVGTYDLEASWRDGNANSWTSEARTFVVGRGEAVLTCLRDANVKPKQGDDFTISGKLLPAGVAALTYRVVDPDGQMKDYPFFTAEDGSYRETNNFFTKKGVWKFKVYWTGSDDWIGTESEWLSIPVEVELGRAIILGGGVAEQSNTYWDVTKTLIVAAYRDFKSRGFTDDMIHLMINGQLDINYDSKIDDVVDNPQPSVTAFLDAIQTRYAAAQNPELNADIPLYIYMQGHGTNDARFKVLGDDQYVNAAQLKGALDTLQKQTGCTVVLIIEACYSGTFIQGLASPEGYKRIILTSADNMLYKTDESGRNAFSRYLFSKLKEGDNFYKAFTYTRNILQNMGYPPPRLEDFSGGVLATAMLLKGDLTWGQRPVIAGIEATSVLEQATTTPIAVNVTRGDVDVEKVWLQVIAPNAQIIGQEGTIAYPEVTLVKNTATGKYGATLSGLSLAGIYKIVVFAQDVDKEVSDPATAFVTVASPPLPGDVNGDGYVTLADAILAMQFATRITPPAGAIQPGYAPSTGDVNKDGKIGFAEVIFILQTVAGMR